jgi:hypothetical protein
VTEAALPRCCHSGARYTDDFVIISENKNYLEELLPYLQLFLSEKLRLELHSNKVTITKYHRGIDFLGYVVFPHYRLLRAKTRKRILRNLKRKIDDCKKGLISEKNLMQSLQSYLGVLSHADAYGLTKSLKNQFWFWLSE